MLDDFAPARAREGSLRLGAAMASSVVLYGALGVGVVAASALARRVVVEEDLVQLEFAPAPEPVPEPPPPPPPVAAPRPAEAPRLGRARPALAPPDEIPDERPPESEGPLAPPGDPFAPEDEGDPNGVAGGTGVARAAIEVAPSPPPEPAPRPRGPVRVVEGSTPPEVDRAEIVRHFEVPDAVRSAGVARITLVVRVTVSETGELTAVDVLRGHPLIPEENIVRAVRAARFGPARLADGTPYAAIHTIPITIAVTL